MNVHIPKHHLNQREHTYDRLDNGRKLVLLKKVVQLKIEKGSHLKMYTHKTCNNARGMQADGHNFFTHKHVSHARELVESRGGCQSQHACKHRVRYSAVKSDKIRISCSDMVIFVLYLSN